MKSVLKSHHPRRHISSFKYAFSGVLHTLLNEANFRIQILITTVTVLLGIYLGLTNTQWAILTLAMGLLLSAEMINTLIENFIDVLIKEYHEGAKIIKDVSAGFVLITAITALIVLLLIFSEPLLRLI